MFYDQEAQCHECNRRLVLVRYVQVCPECDSLPAWPRPRHDEVQHDA